MSQLLMGTSLPPSEKEEFLKNVEEAYVSRTAAIGQNSIRQQDAA